MVNEVYDKPFDVATIMILVSHDQDGPISERAGVQVCLANLEPDDLC
jgi:hypothetical protein